MSKPKKYANGLQFVIQDLGDIDPTKFDKTGEARRKYFVIGESVTLLHLPQNHEDDYEMASNSDGYVSVYLTEQEVDMLIGDQFHKAELKEINNEDDKPRIFTTIELLQEAQKEENQGKEVAPIDHSGDYKFFIRDKFIWNFRNNEFNSPVDVFSYMSYEWYFLTEEEVTVQEAMEYLLDGFDVKCVFHVYDVELQKCFKSNSESNITPHQVLNGKWYVIKQN